MNGFTSIKVTNYNALTFHWREQEQNIAQNYTIIAWNLILSSSSYGQIITSQKKNCTIEVNGSYSNLLVDVAIDASDDKGIASGTTKIYHNADGTKAFSYSFMVDFSGINFGGTALGEKRGTGSGTLTTIPKASLFNITDTIYLGRANTIKITPASNSFTHTIKYKWLLLGAQQEGVIATKSTATNIAFTLPLDLALTIPNAKYGAISFTCITYDANGNELGTTSSYHDAFIDGALFSPTLTPTVRDVNDTSINLTGNDSIIVSGISSAQYTFAAGAQLGATIVKRYLKNGRNEIINAANSGTITADGGTFIFEVEDSRGFTNSQIYRATEVNYYHPTCEITNIYADTDNELLFTISGSWFNGSFGAYDNSIGVMYRYKDIESGAYSDYVAEWDSGGNITIDGYKYSIAVRLTDMDYKKTYLIEALAIDTVGQFIYAEDKLSRVTPVFDWSKEDFAINVPTTVQGGKVYGAHVLFDGSSADTIYIITADNVSYFSDYDYIEIIYTDNNGRGCGSTKVFDIKEGDVRTIDLSLIEASSTTGTYIRRTSYYCNNYALFPETTTAGYAWLNGNTVQHVTGTNYLRIIKVIGYK